MKIKGIRGFYPAHSTNYTSGTGGLTKKFFTVHHTAGFESTLRYLWGNPARNGSSHFFVGQGYFEQYVDTNDTAWTNGNFRSNQESLTCETRGDWRGYKDQKTLDSLSELMYQCLKKYPDLKLTYHMDVSDNKTLCPADLKHKGYAKKEWEKAKARIAKENAPKPVPNKITYKKITPKRVEVKTLANLWDFNFTKWGDAKPKNPVQFSKGFPKGHQIDVVAVATNALGGKYYMTAWSFNNGNVRSTTGVNINDVKDYVPPKPIPVPKPKPEWVKMDNPRKMVTTIALRVIDLDTMKPTGDPVAKGIPVDLVDKKTMSNNKTYVRSKWAKSAKKNWGMELALFDEVPSVEVEPPVEIVPPTPIDTNPDKPSDSDNINARLTALELVVQSIINFLTGIFSGFKK